MAGFETVQVGNAVWGWIWEAGGARRGSTMPRRQSVFDLTCMLCGRHAGQVIGGRYVATIGAVPPLVRAHGLECQSCGGRMYLEQDPVTDAKHLVRAS